MRRLDWFLILLLIVGAVGGKILNLGDDDGAQERPPDTIRDQPRRPEPRGYAPRVWGMETKGWLTALPKSKRNEIPAHAPIPHEGVILDDGKRSSTTGSAFSLSDDGVWLTARHVAEGCDTTWIQIAPKKALKVRRTIIHPRADVAVLTTRGGPSGLTLSDAQPRRGDAAFKIGFPKGAPGAVHGSYLGEIAMRHRGRNGYREKVNVWSEVSRIPGQFGSLGGLSGGAVFDDTGRIIGVVEAESRRRGRIMTAKPRTMREIITRAQVNVKPGETAGGGFSRNAYPQAARRLITTLRIARVVCRVNVK